METRIEAQFDPASGLFVGLVENLMGQRDSEWPRKLNTLLDDRDSPIIPQNEPPAGKLWKVNATKSGWMLISDNRGTWFNKNDGSRLLVNDLNIQQDVSNYTKVLPVCPFPCWDESSRAWVIDDARRIEAENKELKQVVSSISTQKLKRECLYGKLFFQLSGDSIDGAYDLSRPLIQIDGKLFTVDEANNLWLYYQAEGNNNKATTIQSLIFSAKDYIRTLMPD